MSAPFVYKRFDNNTVPPARQKILRLCMFSLFLSRTCGLLGVPYEQIGRCGGALCKGVIIKTSPASKSARIIVRN